VRDDYRELFNILSRNLEVFITEVRNKKSTLLATDKWSVKDVLCHIVFWHEAYAANYKSLADRTEPIIPEPPTYRLNVSGVKSLRKYSTDVLIKRLDSAHKSLYKSIVLEKVSRMTYLVGGRSYETTDFLDMVARHIATHTKQVRRVKYGMWIARKRSIK